MFSASWWVGGWHSCHFNSVKDFHRNDVANDLIATTVIFRMSVLITVLAQSAAGSEAHSAPAAACRMQKLKEVLDMRERCIAHLQDKLRHQQAHHAQVLASLR